jgi:AraC-like DNA-binding protein
MKKNIFEILLTIFGIGLLIQILLMMKRYDFPIALIFGPILFFAFLNQLNKKLPIIYYFLHFIPFIIVSILFYTIGENQVILFRHIYFITTLSSLFIYPALVIFSKKRDSSFINEKNLILLEILAILGLAVFFFLNIIYINHISNNFTNVYEQLVIISLMVINVGIVTWFLISNRFSPNVFNENNSKKTIETAYISEEEIQLIKSNINQIMETEKLYLDAHFSLEKLAKISGHSKVKISYYIKDQLNVEFEDWLATFRVNHAVDLIHKNDGNLKLEYLANLSGFDSRTAFNKYFKHYVGESPSNYRNKLTK